MATLDWLALEAQEVVVMGVREMAAPGTVAERLEEVRG